MSKHQGLNGYYVLVYIYIYDNSSWFESFVIFYLQRHFDSSMIASYFGGVAVLSSDHCVMLCFV